MKWPHLTADAQADGTDDLSFRATVRHQMSADGPARLTLAVANESTQSVLIDTGVPEPFDELVSCSGPSRLFLAPIVDTYGITGPADQWMVPDAPVDECWRFDGPIVKGDTGLSYGVGPGEVRGREHVPLELDGEACFPSGTYRFESTASLRIGDPDGEKREAGEVTLWVELTAKR
ncbi:hypothetical protein AUR64_15000 [Haloprofundus marisrubri]|uniref:Intracellular proteinase inhibitor BsuPI domain-containing protein n=1 Tax=Haloprofundus marisrubri TaxID=1514971 RepID=A0A0W1R738_9EURY|nr:hypothetical protein [Haloprofundus marisrubri]KTG09103.1 hypothetical protein AUR64_15000 [Haloprofundus marisrubri]